MKNEIKLAIETGIYCQKVLVPWEDLFRFGPSCKFSKRLCERVQKLHKNIGQNCIDATTNSVNVGEADTQAHIDTCVAMLQTLKVTLRKLKEKHQNFGSSEVIKALLINKPEPSATNVDKEKIKPFLLDLLA
jgi:hypothetical protein